jgi:hypothetical protein
MTSFDPPPDLVQKTLDLLVQVLETTHQSLEKLRYTPDYARRQVLIFRQLDYIATLQLHPQGIALYDFEGTLKAVESEPRLIVAEFTLTYFHWLVERTKVQVQGIVGLT